MQDSVTWYKITYTGKQVAQWDFLNKGRLPFLEVPLCNLLTSICNFVPCDWVLQRAYSPHNLKHVSFHSLWEILKSLCWPIDSNEFITNKKSGREVQKLCCDLNSEVFLFVLLIQSIRLDLITLQTPCCLVGSTLCIE